MCLYVSAYVLYGIFDPINIMSRMIPWFVELPKANPNKGANIIRMLIHIVLRSWLDHWNFGLVYCLKSRHPILAPLHLVSKVSCYSKCFLEFQMFLGIPNVSCNSKCFLWLSTKKTAKIWGNRSLPYFYSWKSLEAETIQLCDPIGCAKPLIAKTHQDWANIGCIIAIFPECSEKSGAL